MCGRRRDLICGDLIVWYCPGINLVSPPGISQLGHYILYVQMVEILCMYFIWLVYAVFSKGSFLRLWSVRIMIILKYLSFDLKDSMCLPNVLEISYVNKSKKKKKFDLDLMAGWSILALHLPWRCMMKKINFGFISKRWRNF